MLWHIFNNFRWKYRTILLQLGYKSYVEIPPLPAAPQFEVCTVQHSPIKSWFACGPQFTIGFHAPLGCPHLASGNTHSSWLRPVEAWMKRPSSLRPQWHFDPIGTSTVTFCPCDNINLVHLCNLVLCRTFCLSPMPTFMDQMLRCDIGPFFSFGQPLMWHFYLWFSFSQLA
jgi:hypothetical protein